MLRVSSILFVVLYVVSSRGRNNVTCYRSVPTIIRTTINQQPQHQQPWVPGYQTTTTIRQRQQQPSQKPQQQPSPGLQMHSTTTRGLSIRFEALDVLSRRTRHRRITPTTTFQQSTTKKYDSLKISFVSTSSPLLLYSSFIPHDDLWGNISILFLISSLSQYLGERTSFGKLLGGPVTAMAITFVSATIRILAPGGTVASRTLQNLVLQLATPLILLGAQLQPETKKTTTTTTSSNNRTTLQEQYRPLVISFLLASFGTLLGCIIGWYLIGPMLNGVCCKTNPVANLGLQKKDGMIIAAALLSKNIGGGINYIAVCSTLNASSNAIAAGLCVDNIFALLYFPIVSILAKNQPDVVGTTSSRTQSSSTSSVAIAVTPTISSSTIMEDDTTETQPEQEQQQYTVANMTKVLMLACSLLWIGELLGKSTNTSLPICTFVTILFSILANYVPTLQSFLQPLRNIATQFGTVCLYLFFTTAGAPGLSLTSSSIRVLFKPLSLFLLCLYGIHGTFLYICHQFIFPRTEFVRIPRLLVASSAAIGGPATAVTLAQTNQWKNLQVPSIIVGNIGYAIATFIGLLYYYIIQK